MNREPRESAGPGWTGAPASGRASRASTIIVPLDGSVHATAALPVARVLAELERATLRIVHVAEPIMPPLELLRAVGLTPELLRGSVIDQAVGPPAASIVRLATELQSGLIVMCMRTATAEPTGGLGSVAEAVVREAPCPVVLVPPRRGVRPWTLRRIVVPHDGTPTTAAAFAPASELAQRTGAELDVLHIAVSEAGRPAEPGTFTVPQYVDQPQHEWPEWSREFLDRTRCLCGCPAAVPTRLFLRTGKAGAEIVQFAGEHESDLIVLAWHGSLKAKRATTVKEVIENAPCPILMLRVAA